MAISEFGFSLLMLILLMRYMHDNKWFEAKKCILKPTALYTNKAKRGILLLDCVTLHCFFYLNLTISPLDKAYNSLIYKGVFHEDVTYQHPLFVNSSNNNEYNCRCDSSRGKPHAQ